MEYEYEWYHSRLVATVYLCLVVSELFLIGVWYLGSSSPIEKLKCLFFVCISFTVKTVGCGIFVPSSNFDTVRPEAAASDVISGMIVDPAGVDICVKYGDSRSHHLEIFKPLTL